ncbi:hypothetical protein FE257_001790 [Aspergillus nanangensis]|uniref:Zn(2)-C6 fungal-type domain-containing protein n=1 Tax=Aspergillus nanangensis TaxID=2582783 RepID=A0AAD4CDD6_ASPNN|nr:hypothetical protein FE257_001790 [Aspergillus nanangensis]
MQLAKRRRNFVGRSLTGCRTCRARHIKCDEAPGVCNNCVSTKRTCDGYDISRLRGRKIAASCRVNVAVRLDWLTTTDERRCLSYFIHCSLSNLGAFFDSSFWQKRVPQLSFADRAVYHTAVMLGALHEESIQNKMRLSGENLTNAHQKFALEQRSRAFFYLSRRNASEDPQFRETLLLCCLLFALADLIWARYENALQHLRGGLQILKEIPEVQAVDPALLETFKRLDIQSSHFGLGKPFLFSNDEREECWPNHPPLLTLESLHDVKQSVDSLTSIGIPFLANCWPLSNVEIAANYGDLWHKQTWLLSNYKSLRRSIDNFRSEYDTQANYKELQALDLLQLQCLGQILSLETCLMDEPAPASMIPDYVTLLSACQHFMAQLSNPPTISLTYGVIAILYVVASRCPQFLVQLEAIHTLLSWPHCEGFINSNMTASLALASVKRKLEQNDQPNRSLCDKQTEQELSHFLVETLRLSAHSESWSVIRAATFV